MCHSDSPAVGLGCPADEINNVFILPALLTGMGVLLSPSCRESKTIQAVNSNGFTWKRERFLI